MNQAFQLAIIGAGPAGISAGIYAQRYGIDFTILGSLAGGAINEARKVDNYPGIKSINGAKLTQKFVQHLNQEIEQKQIKNICQDKEKFKISTNQETYFSQAIILALGMKIRKLNFENSDKFLNRGISYYVPNNLKKLQNKTVAVIGGGDSALDTAIKLSNQAKKVYLIHRREEFRGADSLVKQVQAQKNIELVLSAQIEKALGDKEIKSLVLNNQTELKINQVFIEIGGMPNSELCSQLGIKMQGNFIETDKNQATNISGVFAAGDITNNPLKQIITAAAEGAIASFSAFKYLKQISH